MRSDVGSRACLPWAAVPAARIGDVVGVLTDVDDTLTTDGAITADALAALAGLRAGGFHVVAVTGRSLGWSRPFAADWPLDAIVAENGAVALVRNGAGVSIEFAQTEAERRRNALRLAAVAERVLCEVPAARLAADSAGRVTDIAVDHAEFARLAADDVARVVAVMRAEGLNASVSSIHVNGWIGGHDKLTGATWALRRLFGRDLDAPGERERWVWIGDSPNDQTMFEAMPLSVGVANLMRFADRLAVWPTYLTRGERGAGFAEVAARLLGR